MNSLRFGPAFALLLLLASCSSNSSAPAGQPDAGAQQDITDVIYVGGTTDDALRNMLDFAPKNDPRHALMIESPDFSAPLPSDSPATFKFSLAAGAQRAPGLRLGPTPQPRTRSQWQRAMHEVVQFLSPERVAHAHLTPYSGNANYLVFSDAKSHTILQVFTPELSFTPEMVDWKNLAQAAQPLKLSIISAFFDQNTIQTDDGPFVGGTFTFTIQ